MKNNREIYTAKKADNSLDYIYIFGALKDGMTEKQTARIEKVVRRRYPQAKEINILSVPVGSIFNSRIAIFF